MQVHILIVDDDRQKTNVLEQFFTKNGYLATGVYTAGDMFKALDRDAAILVVLDLFCPTKTGSRLQGEGDVPIIMLSARNEIYDRVVSLEIRADDYLTKPYEPQELLARVRSVSRCCRSGKLDLGLSRMEFSFVQALIVREGHVVSRANLVDLLYGAETDVFERAIDAHVARLRRKLAQVPGENVLIATVHGEGNLSLCVERNPAHIRVNPPVRTTVRACDENRRTRYKPVCAVD